MKMEVVRTLKGTDTHVSAESEHVDAFPQLAGFLSVKCGAVRNSGTKTIKISDEVNAETVTCEKCRKRFGL